MNEIIPALHPRKKWKNETDNLKPGGLVLEVDPNLPKGLWKLAKVEEVQPSLDDKVRTVTVRYIPGGECLKRPIVRLLPLEFQSE